MARASTGSRRSAVGSASEHAEIIGDDLEAGALLACLVLPFAGLNAPLDEDQRTFLQILLRNLGLFTPHNDLVPPGALLDFAPLVLIGFISGQRKVGYGLPAARITRFRIPAQSSDENYFVD